MNQQVAFITGASKGIGAAIAVELAKQGYSLAITARHVEQLNEVAKQCREYNVEVLVLPADVSDRQALQNCYKQCIEKFKSINVLVVNQGIGGFSTAFADDKDDHWEKVIDVNLRASMFLTRIFLPNIINSSKVNKNSCAIIYIASVAAKRVLPNFAAYCASKFGLYGFAQAIFEEVRDYGIKVSAVCPGWVNTEMATLASFNTNFKDMIQSQDIAQLLTYIINTPATMCPVDITIMPQKNL